ncbi:MAG: hypothetical protein H6727_11325 [Myxococcales bacterium]|nr:hypothetical protein [Myxococcales bacterium]
MRQTTPTYSFLPSKYVCLLVGWCFVALTSMAHAQKETTFPVDPPPPRHRLALSAQFDLSNAPQAPFGGGLRIGYQYRMLAQIHLGAWLHWTYHGPWSFLRTAVGLHILLDMLPIMPFLQASFGLQARFREPAPQFGPDVHLAVGLEIPLNKRWRLGGSYHLYLPTSPEDFPVTQSVLLHTSLVW